MTRLPRFYAESADNSARRVTTWKSSSQLCQSGERGGGFTRTNKDSMGRILTLNSVKLSVMGSPSRIHNMLKVSLIAVTYLRCHTSLAPLTLVGRALRVSPVPSRVLLFVISFQNTININSPTGKS